MKILIVAMKYYPASGGSATYADNLALGLHNEDYDILMLAPSYSMREMDDSASPFKIKRMRFARIKGVDPLRMLIAAIQIYIQSKKFKPDVIWATSFAGCRALGYLTFLREILIGTIHGGIQRRYPSKKILNRFTDRIGLQFMKRADKLVTISEEAKKLILKKLPYDFINKKLAVVYNSITFDEKKFMSSDEAYKLLPDMKQHRVIVTVSRLVAAKGHDVVIRAMQSLIVKFPEIKYVIIGEGPERKTLEALVNELNLYDYVIFTGYVEEHYLEAYYAVCDVFVMAGRWTPDFVEGFGLVYIEAGLRGIPVIGTNVGGIPEAIEDNKTGFIVEPENHSILAEKISLLLVDRKLKTTIGTYAAKKLKERFANKVMAENNAEIIKTFRL